MTELVMSILKCLNWRWRYTYFKRLLTSSIVEIPTEDPDDKHAAFLGRLCTGISPYVEVEVPDVRPETWNLVPGTMSGLGCGSVLSPLSVWTWALSRLILRDWFWNSGESRLHNKDLYFSCWKCRSDSFKQ